VLEVERGRAQGPARHTEDQLRPSGGQALKTPWSCRTLSSTASTAAPCHVLARRTNEKPPSQAQREMNLARFLVYRGPSRTGIRRPEYRYSGFRCDDCTTAAGLTDPRSRSRAADGRWLEGDVSEPLCHGLPSAATVHFICTVAKSVSWRWISGGWGTVASDSAAPGPSDLRFRRHLSISCARNSMVCEPTAPGRFGRPFCRPT